MSLTSAQQEAIAARGNVLIMAGAGTGKTRTLVERCLDCLFKESPPASLDEIMMVTFTEAAAAEMRQRIRTRVEEELAANPQESRWQEQLALFDTAPIGTLHSFCLQLVRQHFYELGLDPQLSVLPEEEARLLADETLEAVLQEHYAGRGPAAEAVQQLIQAQGRGWDKPIRALILRLHHYTQTTPDPSGWFEGQLAELAKSEPELWRQWLVVAIGGFRDLWLPLLEPLAAQNAIANKCLSALKSLKVQPSRAEAASLLEAIATACKNCPHGRRTAWLKPLEKFRAAGDFLASLTQTGVAGDPLTEDWDWVRFQMTTLLRLAREFETTFTDAKRELGVVDFHDLEQHALRLLWDPKAGRPTKTALQWRKKLRFIFVDEYQDINAAQDKIIEAISRDGAQANRFLVGDVKQSIYRFRQANPRIFQGYAQSWRRGNGTTIPLVENFRSREGVLNFINAFFGKVMRPQLGGVAYDGEAQLRFGAPEARSQLSVAATSDPCVELHLRVKSRGKPSPPSEEEGGATTLAQLDELEDADKEARLIALRLREIKAQKRPIWDEAGKRFRSVEWRDMAILLRSPSNKSEHYAKEFSRLNVPLLVSRVGFYQSLEISDLLSLLQLLDNPLQDIPVLAVLHSPLVGLTLNELATIRLTLKGPFWTALVRWKERAGREERGEGRGEDREAEPAAQKANSEAQRSESEEKAIHAAETAPHASRITHHATSTYQKVTTFLNRFAHWRRLARQVSLSRCLEEVLSETHYDSWLLTQPRGEQRHANVKRLLSLAQQFDQFQRQGLFRFLAFIQAQQLAETEPEVAAVSEENSVRLMSIHQSKGLEFPVVVVADIGKSFNTSDQRANIILDEEYGLCPQIKPPHTGKSFPSLPHWLASQRQNLEMLGEELRLLYVAMTRARDTLILSGSISNARFEQLWQGTEPVSPATVMSARNYADWLGYWFSQQGFSGLGKAKKGGNELLSWVVHDETRLVGPHAAPMPPETHGDLLTNADPKIWQKLEERLVWTYPFTEATLRPAKTSVSVLRRKFSAEAEDASVPLFQKRGRGPRLSAVQSSNGPKVSAADLGSAHHAFLQFVSLDHVGSVEELKKEAARLVTEQTIKHDQAALLDFKALSGFWQSALGQKVRAQAKQVRRELPFTVRFSIAELTAFTGELSNPLLQDEFAVVQGVADLAVILPEEIWIIDFKTDAVDFAQLPDKAKEYELQLKLYALALTRIYKRPVTDCWLYFLAPGNAVRVEVKDEGTTKECRMTNPQTTEIQGHFSFSLGDLAE